MKIFIFLLSLIPSIVMAQGNYREATLEERNLILQNGGEEKLKAFGDHLAHETENTVFEKAMVEELMAKGSLDPMAIHAYIQHLTNQGMSKSEIECKIEHLSNMYFAELQLKNISSILPESKLSEHKDKFKDAALESLDQNISSLDADISNSEVTKLNESKSEKLKNDFLKVSNEQNFLAEPSTNTSKMYSPVKVMVPENFSQKMDQVTSEVNKDAKPLFHQVWFAWGYNRGFHSNTDVKFTTKDGTFMIHDAVGKDRQTAFGINWFNPTRISIPQYNLEVGVMFNKHWGMDFHADHMKYVFDNSLPYEITGNYNHLVATNTGVVTFDQAAANHDATWLRFEHTNGYNYPSLGLVYNQNLFQTKNNKFSIDARMGAGAGLVVPKTEVWIYQDNPVVRYGIDNKFHVAGGGVHGDLRLKFTFWDSFFIQIATRGTYIKVKNALVDGAEARIEHIQPIQSLEVIGQIGYQYTFGKRKSKR